MKHQTINLVRRGRMRSDYDPSFRTQRQIYGKRYCRCKKPVDPSELPVVVQCMAADLKRQQPFLSCRKYYYDVTEAEWRAIRWFIFWLDMDTCMYCGRPAEHIDHIIPVTRGGSFHPENCVSACADCNCKKNDRTPQEAGMTLAIW